jgi:hypothetical protein
VGCYKIEKIKRGGDLVLSIERGRHKKGEGRGKDRGTGQM